MKTPRTFWLGLGIIVLCEVMLITDISLSGRSAVRNAAEMQTVLADAPTTPLGRVARWFAINLTAIAWLGYVILLDGLLQWRWTASPVRQRRHHFAMLCFASIFIWCIFDAINFNLGMGAWTYIGLPPELWRRVSGYLVAFGAIVPGMLLSGQVLLNLGLFDWARSPAWRMPRWGLALSLVAGVAMLAWPILQPTPIANLTLWTSLVFLLDPINYALGRPSMFRDWSNGWYGRTLALFAGGLACGFLWEFWNYWALAKWTYHLPFLGPLEHFRYFEMPLPGLLGFLPFGVECWVMWQTIRIALDGLVEPLPTDRDLL